MTKKLHDFQRRILAQLAALEFPAKFDAADRASGVQEVAIVYPQGSGKTFIVATEIAMWLGTKFSHALFLSPQSQINDGLIEYGRPAGGRYRRARVGDVFVDFSPPAGAGSLFVEVGERAAQTNAGVLKSYLDNPSPGHAAVACYASIWGSRIAESGESVTAFLSAKAASAAAAKPYAGRVLFLDEAHHNIAPELSKFLSAWLALGGSVVYLTATPFRSMQTIIPRSAKIFYRSYAEHVCDGRAPDQMRTEIVAVGRADGGEEAISAREFEGEALPRYEYAEAIVQRMADKWEASGKPKLFVRVPAIVTMDPGTLAYRSHHYDLIGMIVGEFQKRGARIFDASNRLRDEDGGVVRRFKTMLASERSVRSYDESRWDVVVGINRLVEGSDWPLGAAVYFVGMPRELWQILQTIGRGSRDKKDIEGYPDEWKDLVEAVFFIPCASPDVFDRLGAEHTAQALVTCCMLADYQVGEQILGFRTIRDGLLRAFAKDSRKAEEVGDAAGAAEAAEMDDKAKLYAAWALVSEDVRGRGVAAAQLVQRISIYEPTIPADVVTRFVVRKLSRKKSIEERLLALLEENARRAGSIPEALKAAFDAALEEFAKETLVLADDPVARALERHMGAMLGPGRKHVMTGSLMQRYASYFRAPDGPLDEARLFENVRKHAARFGSPPAPGDGPLPDYPEYPGITWAHVSRAVTLGLRGVRRFGSFKVFVFHAQEIGDSWVDELEEIYDFHHSGDWSVLHETPEAYYMANRRTLPFLDKYRSLMRAYELLGKPFVGVVGPEVAAALGSNNFYVEGKRKTALVNRFKEVLLAQLDAGEEISPAEAQRQFRSWIGSKTKRSNEERQP
ncbi:MAG TPA: hypothetical protein VFA98_01080 [Thermoanaerobaculia bacterium]|nr:hypothetical protein [Thermoanaerobaculia bacterium]